MKRGAILTTVFAILGSIIIASGCGAGKTASTNGGTGNASDCMNDCAQGCMSTCEDQCHNCSIDGGRTYDCLTFEGMVGFWTEFNCMVCSGCFENMINGNCYNDTPQE